MMTHLARIAEKVVNRPLMIEPGKLAIIASILDGRIGIDTSAMTPDASRFVGAREKDADGNRKVYRTTADGVAIIEISGSLVNRYSFFDALSGVSSYEQIKHQVAAAAADPDVSAILLDIDSPGGEAIGAFEAADVVRAAAAVKPVTAIVNGMTASAAYAIASAATKIVSTSSGVSGSIGVVLLHADYSHKLHDAGVKPTLIHAGARKVDGNPYQPLTDDVRSELKAEVERFYDLFVDTVARGRPGLTPEAIRATEARTFLGADAVAQGLADEVGSFETALADLSRVRTGRINPVQKGRQTMATFTQEQMDSARADAHAAGKAEGIEAGKKAGLAEGEKVGATAERARIGAILKCGDAKGREGLAMHCAFDSDMTAESAAKLLAASSKGDVKSPLAAAMAATPAATLGPGGERAAPTVASAWDRAVAKVNSRFA